MFIKVSLNGMSALVNANGVGSFTSTPIDRGPRLSSSIFTATANTFRPSMVTSLPCMLYVVSVTSLIFVHSPLGTSAFSTTYVKPSPAGFHTNFQLATLHGSASSFTPLGRGAIVNGFGETTTLPFESVKRIRPIVVCGASSGISTSTLYISFTPPRYS